MKIIETIKTWIANASKSKEESNYKKLYSFATRKSEEIYNIKKYGDHGYIFCNGKQVTTLEDEPKLVEKLFQLREFYVAQCLAQKELL